MVHHYGVSEMDDSFHDTVLMTQSSMVHHDGVPALSYLKSTSCSSIHNNANSTTSTLSTTPAQRLHALNYTSLIAEIRQSSNLLTTHRLRSTTLRQRSCHRTYHMRPSTIRASRSSRSNFKAMRWDYSRLQILIFHYELLQPQSFEWQRVFQRRIESIPEWSSETWKISIKIPRQQI